MYFAPGTLGSVTTERLTLRHDMPAASRPIVTAASAAACLHRGETPLRLFAVEIITTSWCIFWLTAP